MDSNCHSQPVFLKVLSEECFNIYKEFISESWNLKRPSAKLFEWENLNLEILML